MPDPIHHIHKRKEKHLAPYPHPNPFARAIDKLVYAVGIMVPAVTCIQVYKIWHEKNADGISSITFGGYVIGNIIWIVYGLIHKEPPILLMYALLLILNTAVLIGAMLF